MYLSIYSHKINNLDKYLKYSVFLRLKVEIQFLDSTSEHLNKSSRKTKNGA